MKFVTTISLPMDMVDDWESVPNQTRSKLVQDLLRNHFSKTKPTIKQKDSRVEAVYQHYCTTFKKQGSYKLTPQRQKQIVARLKDAGEEMILRAITNLSKSKWHVENNQVHLELVIRSYEQVEKLANMEQKVEESLVQRLLREEREQHAETN